MKTLTDLTPYTETVQKIEAYFADAEEIIPPAQPPKNVFEEYGSDRFLEDVFMDERQYNTLTGLLKHYKNLILQGAPGVGKTYAAKRLAWSMMGVKDEDRVQFVQFHQSYSYEDFIMGFRPTGDGFELKHGSFYEFPPVMPVQHPINGTQRHRMVYSFLIGLVDIRDDKNVAFFRFGQKWRQ